MSDFAPGSEEEFIRQLQEQLANEASGGGGSSQDNGGFDFNPNEAEELKEVIEKDDNSDTKKNDQSKKVKEKKSNEINKNLSKLINFVEIAGAPFVVILGLFFLNHFSKSLIVGILSSLFGAILLGVYYKILISIKLSESYKAAENILNEIGKGKLSFDILNDSQLSNKLGKLAEPIDKVIKEIGRASCRERVYHPV